VELRRQRERLRSKEGGIERVDEGEEGEGEGGDEKERHGHIGGREWGQRLKVAIARCDG